MNTQTNFAEPGMDEEVEGRTIEAQSIGTLMQVNEAEVNRQIMTAHAYPRQTENFRRELMAMVCYDEEVALSCLYALKRSGKAIQGPSIRFAEAALQAWGNARVGTRIVDIGQEFITAQGFFWDLEKNTGLAFEVLRRITNSKGDRYGDDLIMVTGNAAGSIALRNAILKGIPKTAWDPIYKKCRLTSTGASESMSDKRDKMFLAFAPLNVDRAQIFGLLGVKGQDDISFDDLIFMGGILNSIKEGEQKVEEVFALENMSHPDQVKPQQPRRSDFAGSDKPKGDKPAGKPAAEKTAEPAKAEAISKTETAQTGTGPEPAVDTREADRQDWIKDAYKDLDASTRIRDVTDLRERLIADGILSTDEEADWVSACQKKSDGIMESLKQQKAARK